MSPEEYENQYSNVVLHENLPWEVLVRVDCRIDGLYCSVSLVHTFKIDIVAGTSGHAWGLMRETRPYKEMSGDREFEEMSEDRAVSLFHSAAEEFVNDRIYFSKNSLARMVGNARGDEGQA